MKTFTKLAEEANALPILDVVESVGWEAFGNGETKKGQSPLRNSGSKDSFTISENRNIFRDWVLDSCGGPITFYMTYYELGFKAAVEKLANVFKLGDYHGTASIDASAKTALTSTPKIEQRQLDHELLNEVYNLFLDCLSLQEDDKQYLLSRGLSEEEIIQNKFRSCPKRRTVAFLKNFEAIIREKFETTNVLFEVPGFYKVVGQPFNFQHCSGIFIPTRHADGKIIALQVRTRDESSGLRYYWFSSASCLTTSSKVKYERNGLSCGAQIHYELGPKGNKVLFVTEGFFKAVTLRKTYGYDVATVQGVSNWKGVIPLIGENVNRVIIAFDADMCYNPSVAIHAMNFGVEAIKKVNKVDVLLWDCNLGKGIDDYLLAGNKDIVTKGIKEFEVFAQDFKAKTLEFVCRDKDLAPETSEEELIRKSKIREVFQQLLNI